MNHDSPKFSPGYKRPVSWLLLRLIDAYDVTLGPHLGGRCRFEPSCSNYMREAIVIYGIVKGITMGVKRLIRCGPWSKGGYDPVVSDYDCSDFPPKFSLGGQKGGANLKSFSHEVDSKVR